jgi:hypothetical protein
MWQAGALLTVRSLSFMCSGEISETGENASPSFRVVCLTITAGVRAMPLSVAQLAVSRTFPWKFWAEIHIVASRQ